MSQRNFPPSFWNSTYQPPPPSGALSASSHQDLPGFTADPYGHMTASSLHSMHSSLHNDPWRYPLTTQAYSHHAVPDFAGYSSAAAMAASSGRFNPHYGSLLPGGRFGTMPSQCDPLSKHTETWTARYTHTELGSNLPAHHDSMAASLHGVLGGGIETAVQDSKDLYWF
ncbi:hypothetical protein LSH36_355g01006 [Paralvinella palmiformis]|uniref:Uncharacterized protein n=1 Tax=Paralvinella palmiformis TaxID=53620 RepID=A0AAD9JFW1_9ANNE|nr:hypothetical protein LSH36_355g01006 [Paralvinella palmiformis]